MYKNKFSNKINIPQKTGRLVREAVETESLDMHLTEHQCSVLLKMVPGSIKRFKIVGNVKCIALPKRLMRQSPCEHCAFRVMNHTWCEQQEFCMSPARPDHKSVYFALKEKGQEDA